MKIFYWIVVVLVLYLGFNYARFQYILSYSNLPHIQQDDRTSGTGPTLKYIAAGDSTAVGEGASSVEKTYPYKITEYLAGENAVEYKNVAVVGSLTQDLIDKQLDQIISFDPDVVTISIGGNDVTHFKAASKIVENDKKIISKLLEKTKAKIYITDVPNFSGATLVPWFLRLYFDSQSKAANRQLLGLETERVKFVDVHSTPIVNSADQFHPNDDGYQHWTDAFIAKIKSGQ